LFCYPADVLSVKKTYSSVRKRTGTNKPKIINKDDLKIKKPRMPNNIDMDSQVEEPLLLFPI
jgi:hypothetical protein